MPISNAFSNVFLSSSVWHLFNLFNISFINNIGDVVKSIETVKREELVSYGEELPNIMKYLVEIAKMEDVHVKQLWLNALPATIYLDGLKQKYEYKKSDCDINPVIGEYDAPEV